MLISIEKSSDGHTLSPTTNAVGIPTVSWRNTSCVQSSKSSLIGLVVNRPVGCSGFSRISDRQTVECFASKAKKVAGQSAFGSKEEPSTMNKHEGSRRAHKSKKNTNIKAIIDLRGRYWV